MSQDNYLLKHYGITLAERDAIMELQGNKCACCGRKFDADCRIEVDHEHFKVSAVPAKDSVFVKLGLPQKGWYAWTRLVRGAFWAKTKAEAIAKAKKAALRPSVRGILCGGRYAGCNRKLGRIDKPDWLKAVLAYLQDPPARKYLKQFEVQSQ